MKTKIFLISMLTLMLCACAAERKSVYYDPSEYYKIRQKQEEDKKKNAEIEKAEGYIWKVYELTYEDANDAAQRIKSLLSPLGKIKVNIYSNSLIIYDKPEVFESIENSLKELD